MNFFKITNFIKSIFFISFIITLQSCNSNKFIVDKKTNQDEAFIRPPSNFLARNIKFDSLGKIRNDKSIIIINKFDLEVQKEKDKRFSSKKIFKSKRSGFGESWIKKTKDSVYKGLLDKPLYVYLCYTGKEINFYTVWNYKALYNSNDSLNKFDIPKTLKTIDELRLLISDLTHKKKDTFYSNIVLVKNIKTEEYGDEVLLKKGNEQEILNYFFSNLTLPLSLSLYNYGYVDKRNTNGNRPAYFLDNNFSLSVFYHTPTSSPESGYSTHLFHSAKTFSIYKESEKLYINQQWPYDWQSSQSNLDTIGSVSIDLRTPANFFNSGKKHFIIYFPNRDIRTHENRNNLYRKDMMLIGLDNIEDYFKLKYDSAIRTVIKLKRGNNLFYIDYGEDIYRRLFYEISFNIYYNRAGRRLISETIPFGFSYSKFFKAINYKIKRLNSNNRYKNLKTKKGLNLNEIQLLINPYDKIRRK
ncbi:hypothetical protein [uncultured Lacinutrix sp.]|uniref:hypothetical protein n=1 Tax=uncultured Lacinutrix sp. TaxID=574032 RepID=UPI0026191C27|nr:hypothetical protein [uncultured Lacinutrix sp.]